MQCGLQCRQQHHKLLPIMEKRESVRMPKGGIPKTHTVGIKCGMYFCTVNSILLLCVIISTI